MSSHYLSLSILTLLRFMVSIGVVCILVPWIMLRSQTDLTRVERVWASLVIGAACWIALVLSLAPFRCNDMVGLAFVPVLIAALYGTATGRIDIPSCWNTSLNLFVKTSMDLLDGKQWTSLFSQARPHVSAFSRSLPGQDTSGWDYPRIAVWLMCLYGAYLRISDPLTHWSYGFFDPYVHLVWLKELNQGDIFGALYPRGFHALLSAIGVFSVTGANELVRFGGCVVGSAMPAAIFFLLTECGVPWTGAIAGTALIAVCGAYPLDLARQTAMLSEEFGVLFGLLSIAFAVRYLKHGIQRDLWIFSLGSFVAWVGHSYAGALVVGTALCLGIDYLFRAERVPQRLTQLAKGCFASAILGNLYFIFGLALGHPLYGSSLGMVTGNEAKYHEILDLSSNLVDVLHGSMGSLAGPILAVLSITLVVFGLANRRQRFPSPAALNLASLLFFVLWLLRSLLDVNTLIAADRLVLFIELFSCATAAYLYCLVIEPLLGKSVQVRAICATAAVVGLALIYYTPPAAPLHAQYDVSARLCYDLPPKMLPGTWTVVGQNEEYALVLNSGLHMTVAKFLSDYPPADPTPHFPTPYMFILVENCPIPMPEAFRNRDRAIEETHLADWVRIYAVRHSDLRVYRESTGATIYLIYRPDLAQTSRAGELD